MTFSVVILSARAANLVPCVRSVLAHEPELPPERILVVDDGARAEAEPQLPGVRWVHGAKPFVYARNANLGIGAAGTDVVLLNDDARLLTSRGLSLLAEQAGRQPGLGILSAGVRGVVGNPRQLASRVPRFRPEPRLLAFVCVYLPWEVYQQVGPLDERFTGYGWEDNDYCARVLAAGLRLGVWDGCVVDHDGALPSTFRTRPDLLALFEQNRRLYRAKWDGRQAWAAKREERTPMDGERRVDLLYLARNRLEFTRETFTTLLETTDWQSVQRLSIYDDGSEDGTDAWLEAAVARVPAPARFVRTRFGSPVAAMRHWIESASAPILVKTDNDAMLPPGWLRQSLDVLDRHPELALLGIETMNPHADDPSLPRSYSPAPFISGLGLYRRSAFARSRPTPYNRWFGLEEWQMAQGERLVRGWIIPALPVFLLDRIPCEPWRSYSEEYIRRGWQRPWPKYDPSCTLWRWRWPEGSPPAARASLSDPRFLAALRVKNEAAHIHEVIARVLPLCGRVLVLDDHSTDDTAAICAAFGEQVTVIPSPFQGLDEARDKNFLLQRIIALSPEWVLWIDGDEVLERSGPEQLRQAAEQGQGVAAYRLRVAYVWDTPEQVRVDGIYGQFARPSFFRLRGQPLRRLRFVPTGYGGNFHCGNVPQGLVGVTRDLPVRLKHYGYMTREQRLAKYAWYTRVDPNNEVEDHYRHLAEIPGARWAPGPPQLVAWTE